MPTDPVIDLESLTQPISEEKPVGVDLREDTSPNSLYYRIKDARSQARAAERQIEMGDDTAEVDWKPIIQTVPEVLQKMTKDFEIAAYFQEAVVRHFGFAGMRDCCRLIQAFVEKFGDDIYPLPDEDGIETRLAPLVGLNGEDGAGALIKPIKNIPLTGTTSVGEFGLAQYTQAMELSRVDEETRQRRVSQGAITLDTFNLAVHETSAETFGTIRDDLLEAITAFKEMTATLDEKYGNDSPPSSSIRQALEESLEVLEKVAKDKIDTLAPAEEPAEAEAEEGAEPAAAAAPAASANSVEGIRNREDAFRILLQVADYFQRTEPHTPVSYGIKQVVHWGRLPLPELMKELIPDETSVGQMFRLIGIREQGGQENE